jgi:hypothetical protein|tara:strand:+ start:394 stop:687 length:294 start_codon:yes stop_codon:yes gene_type:complete
VILNATLLLVGCRGQNPVFYRQIQYIEYFCSDFGGLRDQGREAALIAGLSERGATPVQNAICPRLDKWTNDGQMEFALKPLIFMIEKEPFVHLSICP